MRNDHIFFNEVVPIRPVLPTDPDNRHRNIACRLNYSFSCCLQAIVSNLIRVMRNVLPRVMRRQKSNNEFRLFTNFMPSYSHRIRSLITTTEFPIEMYYYSAIIQFFRYSLHSFVI